LSIVIYFVFNFSASLRQSSMSHDPSETIQICWFGFKCHHSWVQIQYILK